MTNFILTETHTLRAETMGRNHARVEREMGRTDPHPNPLDDEDVRTIAWDITTVKMEPEDEDAESLATAYLDAYYDEWETL